MATVSTSAEKLAEIKAEDVKPETEGAAAAAPQPASTEAEGSSATDPTKAKDEGDVIMTDEDEKDKTLRAVRQST